MRVVLGLCPSHLCLCRCLFRCLCLSLGLSLNLGLGLCRSRSRSLVEQSLTTVNQQTRVSAAIHTTAAPGGIVSPCGRRAVPSALNLLALNLCSTCCARIAQPHTPR